jgi:hypothetical protein
MCFFIGFLFLLGIVRSADLKILAVFYTILALIFGFFVKFFGASDNISE